MKKSMLQVSVSTTEEGHILIEGEYDHSEGRSDVVVVHPDQVDTLIDWLREAKKELLGDE